jgi:thiosulfate reductase cytochrome b subunit
VLPDTRGNWARGAHAPGVSSHVRNVFASWYDSRVADSVRIPSTASAVGAATVTSRHSALVRTTHWITTLCFLALLVTGAEILLSHPRFYWGETGNNLTQPLFKLPLPASRRLVPTGYSYVLPDQNGWSRYLHFQAAWIMILTGLLYVIWGLFSGHFRKNLLPSGADLSWRAIAKRLRFARSGDEDAWSYNVVQRITYLFVIFILFPLIIWTGLAMSPAFVSEFPATVNLLGGQPGAPHVVVTCGDFLSSILNQQESKTPDAQLASGPPETSCDRRLWVARPKTSADTPARLTLGPFRHGHEH